MAMCAHCRLALGPERVQLVFKCIPPQLQTPGALLHVLAAHIATLMVSPACSMLPSSHLSNIWSCLTQCTVLINVTVLLQSDRPSGSCCCCFDRSQKTELLREHSGDSARLAGRVIQYSFRKLLVTSPSRAQSKASLAALPIIF